LVLVPALQPLGQLLDGARLVPGRLVGGVELERRGGIFPREQGARANGRGPGSATGHAAGAHDRVRSRYVMVNGFSGAQRATNSKVVASFFLAGRLDSRISQSPYACSTTVTS